MTHDFLQALTVVLGVAAVTTVLCQRLHLPVVLGYVLAGLIVGPHVPVPLVADVETVESLSSLGVMLVMFSLGLEVSLRHLTRVGATSGLTALIECSMMWSLGFGAARSLGWSTTESLFTGAMVAISSTTIIIKTFDEQGVVGRLRELVIGVLLVEDLIAIVLLAVLTAIGTGAHVSPGALVGTLGKLAAFLAVLLAAGLVVVPRAVRAVIRLRRPETTLVAAMGLCFAVALVARHFGYSVALGAFIAGSLVAESGHGVEVEHLVRPVRDLFAAVFFVSVGMLIDPALVWQHRGAILLLTGLVVVGKTFTVATGAFLTGAGPRTSLQAGMSLAQIGEFSFVIAALGGSLGATGPALYPVAAAVSVLTTLSTAVMVRWSGPLSSAVDRRLPHRLQTLSALYGSWVEQLSARRRAHRGTVGQRARLLALDTSALVAVLIGVRVARDGLLREVPTWLVVVGATALVVPLLLGIVRVAQRLGAELAELALPARLDGKLDLAAAPRRALVAMLQVALVLAVGLPVVALTRPFFSGWAGLMTLAVALFGVLATLWRSADNLEGHVRAGAQVVLGALLAQAHRGADGSTAAPPEGLPVLPGLGSAVLVELLPTSPAVGQTLASLNVRGLTGATVLALTRQSGESLVPTAREALLAGDRLALTGTNEAVEAATKLLTRPKGD